MQSVRDELNDIRAVIRAGCGYTGVTQAELAAFMGIRPETLSRKMNNKGHFTDDELAIAQEVVWYKAFLKGEGSERVKHQGNRYRRFADSGPGRVRLIRDGAGQ